MRARRECERGARRGPTLAALLIAATASGCAALPTTVAFTPSVIDAARLVQPPAPPTLVARKPSDVSALSRAAGPARLAELAARPGARRFEGPQIPFFFESALGRAYLRSDEGRAIARGEPAESCPQFGAAFDAPDPKTAAERALDQCLVARDHAHAACGCRLLAAGSTLLAPPEAFAYPRGVAVEAIPLDAKLRPAGATAALVAEERYEPRGALADKTAPRVSGMSAAERDALAAGARRLWLLGLSGPIGGLDLAADGAARLTVLDGGREALRPVRLLEGRWRAEGYRRGRLALLAGLESADGERLVILVGYEPAELDAERARLIRESKTLFR